LGNAFTEQRGENGRGWAGQPSQPEIFRAGVQFEACPIDSTMRVLGKKWTMLVLRDVGLRKVNRFNRLLESIHGITPRILSRRLRELEKYGFIDRAEARDSPKIVQWALTEKGRDALPLLLQLVVFGSKWDARNVFKDKKPRSPAELFSPNALALFRLQNGK